MYVFIELCLSPGFESILEGLFGPELVDDPTLFKGKNLSIFTFTNRSDDHTSVWLTWITILWFKHYALSGHYDSAAALYHLVPLHIHSTRRPLWLQKRRCLVLIQSWCFGWRGASVKVHSVLQTCLQYTLSVEQEWTLFGVSLYLQWAKLPHFKSTFCSCSWGRWLLINVYLLLIQSVSLKHFDRHWSRL